MRPACKSGWELPGGVVEENESPKAGCQREVCEELGLDLKIGTLLVVDFNSASEQKPESLLSAYQCFDPDALPEVMSPTLRRRGRRAWLQLDEGGGIYLEDQEPG